MYNLSEIRGTNNEKEEFYRPGSDGITKLHGYIWSPEKEVKGVLQLVHGMVEYIDRYNDFATYLADNGIACIGHDHLGHGKSVTSEDKLGHFADDNGEKYVIEDMHLITEDAKERFPSKKVFILGHSMGSFLLRKYMTQYSEDIAGAIVMGTGYIPAALAGTSKTLSKITRSLKGRYHKSKLLTNLALGSNNKPFEPARTSNDWLSRNEENVDKYNADPLCGYCEHHRVGIGHLKRCVLLLERHLDVIGSTMQRNKNYQPLSEKTYNIFIDFFQFSNKLLLSFSPAFMDSFRSANRTAFPLQNIIWSGLPFIATGKVLHINDIFVLAFTYGVNTVIDGYSLETSRSNSSGVFLLLPAHTEHPFPAKRLDGSLSHSFPQILHLTSILSLLPM